MHGGAVERGRRLADDGEVDRGRLHTIESRSMCTVGSSRTGSVADDREQINCAKCEVEKGVGRCRR